MERRRQTTFHISGQQAGTQSRRSISPTFGDEEKARDWVKERRNHAGFRTGWSKLFLVKVQRLIETTEID